MKTAAPVRPARPLPAARRKNLPALVAALWVAALAALPAFAAPAEAGSPSIAEPATGAGLAARLRSLEPVENSRVSGWLMIKSGRGQPVRQIPVVCRVTIQTDGWESTYETGATPAVGAQKLVIKHSTNAPCLYFQASAPPGSPALPELKPVPPDQLATPLAGSDFTFGELGLDFLFWPQQKRLRDEMRLGQSCYVLESGSASGRRIKSWIDQESVEQGVPGLLIAESYDPKGALLKEFDLGGSSFKKVNGRYQLQQMKIRSFQPRSETTLKFDLSEQKN